MNPIKRNYLTRIRAESAYPTYRSLVNILAWFCFIAGGLIILGGAIAALAAISQGRFEGVGVALAAALAGGGLSSSGCSFGRPRSSLQTSRTALQTTTADMKRALLHT